MAAQVHALQFEAVRAKLRHVVRELAPMLPSPLAPEELVYVVAHESARERAAALRALGGTDLGDGFIGRILDIEAPLLVLDARPPPGHLWVVVSIGDAEQVYALSTAPTPTA